ncbi:MAG TPA: RsmG family class I SAM-dependent methyltransferase [Ilumatobacteraceae bacterium]|jgi:16S rRNA (guanine527-N7)-methyltransferase|nr:RsmG family class I SAM-dependent methyltransferase [Ilumatobacteraceae bacterium]
MNDEPSVALVDALLDAQRLGFLGSRPIPEVIEHARGFVRALRACENDRVIESVLDLGSGGGVPGLIIAHDLPTVRLTLLDRRAKRTDALERLVRRLGWQDRITVACTDVTTFAPDDLFDAVVARGFGPPEFTLAQAVRFVRDGGPIVISEPPDVDRWDDRLLADLGLRRVEAPTSSPSVGGPGDLDGLVAVFLPR